MPLRFQSPTSINTYLKCPRKYYLRYILGLKTKPNIHLIRGKIVHGAISRFCRLNIPQNRGYHHLREVLINLLETQWAKETKKLRLPQHKLNNFYQESRQMLTGWLKRYLKEGLPNPRTEVRLYSKKHKLMGIIDAIFIQNGQVVLVDYKTGSKGDINKDIIIQMGIYALLYKEHFKKAPNIVSIDFLKHKRSRRFGVDEKLIQYAKEICAYVHRNTASKDEKDFPCKCGGYCESDLIKQNGGD